MSPRVQEALDFIKKWSVDALGLWGRSIRLDPEAHALTLLLGFLTAKVIEWVL
jgi:hypothetical protein